MPTSTTEKSEGWVSVTEVISYFPEPGLVDWKIDTGRKEANRISRLAAKTGSRVHELIEADYRNGNYKFKTADNTEVRSCMAAWERFKTDYTPKIECMEYEVKDDDRMVIGHVDMYAIIGGKPVITDIKTAGSIKSAHWIQLGAYAGMDSRDLSQVAVLRLDRHLGVYEFEAEAPRPEIFNCLVTVYDYLTKRAYSPGGTNGNNSTTKAESNTSVS